MERRKIIIYSIFLIVAAYGFYFHFLAGEPSKEVNTPAPINDTMQASISGDEEIIADRTTEKSNEYQLTLRYNRQRNPFENKNVYRGKKPAGGIPVRYAKPNVSAISMGGSGTFVIANNKIIKIGETVGVWRLVKVESEKALFDGPDSTIWASLGG
ncbi:MAG: hypothetical protein JSU85_00885 [Candidatus Zixiibacteriota bacterium]|nr:MAG: hypothetical protein JSU85_00885 [candidate division Zixibacteria bacterium]